MNFVVKIWSLQNASVLLPEFVNLVCMNHHSFTSVAVNSKISKLT